MLCPCGSELPYQQCCLPIINKDHIAQSPEQLMRSRYSAYVDKNAKYIMETYAEESRKQQSISDIAHWAAQCRWLKLIVIESTDTHLLAANVVNDKQNSETYNKPTTSLLLSTSNTADPTVYPTVKFSAYYLIDNQLNKMTENSRFIKELNIFGDKESKEWRYLDGDIIEHGEIALIKRNDLCPCTRLDLFDPTFNSTYKSITTKNTDTKTSKKAKKFKHCCGH